MKALGEKNGDSAVFTKDGWSGQETAEGISGGKVNLNAATLEQLMTLRGCLLYTSQYAPFFAEFRHKLADGGSLLYSWNVGMGVNFAALYAYYLASPLNWLKMCIRDRKYSCDCFYNEKTGTDFQL